MNVKTLTLKTGYSVLTSLRRNSPTIGLVGGIAAGVAGAVWLARVHKKSNIVEDLREDLDEMEDQLDILVEEGEIEPLTDRQKQIAMWPAYGKFVKNAAVEYGPPIALGVVSVVLLVGGHKVQKDRIAEVAAAYAVLSRSFAAYRERVREELGEDTDSRWMVGGRAQTVTQTEKGKDGKKKKTKREVVVAPEELSPEMYQRVFDATNPNSFADPDLSEFFLQSVQQQLNDQLYLRGWVSLNDLYKSLGFEQCSYGQVVGWSNKGSGDGFVDLGIDDPINVHAKLNNSWIVNPNVDGDILNHIK